MVKVIFIGLPQLEMLNFKQAFKQLGYKPYDLIEVYKKNHNQEWYDHFLNKKPVNYKAIFKDYDLLLQSPASHFYKDLLKNYPNAKVIIQDLDSRIWFKRHKKIRRFFKLFSFLRVFKRSGSFLKLVDLDFYYLFKGDDSPIHTQSVYNQIHLEVKSYVPKNQLLIFSPKNGWEELCSFLDKPIPTSKFPIKLDISNLNRTTKEIVLNIFKDNAIILILYFGTLISLISYLIFFY